MKTLQEKIDFTHPEKYGDCNCNTMRCHATILEFKHNNNKAIQELREELLTELNANITSAEANGVANALVFAYKHCLSMIGEQK